MLSCILGNNRINCFDSNYSKEELKRWANKNILLCPVCKKPYEYCHGRIQTPYFRHKDKVLCEDKYSEAETEEHIKGKQDLFEWISKQKGVTDVVIEGWLPETKQRPDIMFKYKGKQCVIEYQCTPIATEYYERHNLYQAAGIEDIWICGTEKYFNSNRTKFIEGVCCGYYNSSTKRYILRKFCIQNDVLKSFKRLERKYEHNDKLDYFVFIGDDIVYYCLNKQDYRNAISKHLYRRSLKKELKNIEIKKFENRIEFIKNNLKSYQVTVHYPNYWDRNAAYIRFFRNSYNTIHNNESIYLNINAIIKIEEIKNKIKRFNNKTWNFNLHWDDDNSKAELTIIIHNKQTGAYLNDYSVFIPFDDINKMQHDIEYCKLILLDSMKNVIKSNDNQIFIINK